MESKATTQEALIKKVLPRKQNGWPGFLCSADGWPPIEQGTYLIYVSKL